MDGYLSNKPDNFVDDPEKLYRLWRREAQQAKMLDFKSEDEGSLESLNNSPPRSPWENRLPPMGEQPKERKI
jgi:muconolactone delta-isomerase